MKQLLCVILYLLIIQFQTFASHLMGGEITWTCESNGKYIFHMKLYRDCNGIPGPLSVTLHTDAPGLINGILLDTVSVKDDSPVCNPAGPAITCAGAAGTTAGAVQEFVYQSAPVVLNGVPPATGWTFWYTDCCRNAAIVNLSISSASFTLRAKMFPFQGRNANPCFDNSPQFYEPARTILCTGYPFVFNHNAKDLELDSLSYDWDHPLNDNASQNVFNAPVIPYQSPYTYTQPLPGPFQDPLNVAPVLDQSSGEVSYTSFTQGSFVFVLKVSAYRCGIKVAEIYREIQEVLALCPELAPGYPNNPPVLLPPFRDSSGTYSLFIDSVRAGDLVSFTLHVSDPDLDTAFHAQNIHYKASGIEFDSSVTGLGNCPYPPCATLSPLPAGHTATVSDSIIFNWHTPACSPYQHGYCSAQNEEYFFNLTFYDDFCPIPAEAYRVIKIVVIGDSVPDIYQSGDTLYCSLQSIYYQWYMNDSAITGATSNYIIPNQNAFYHVETTYQSGCSALSRPVYFAPTFITADKKTISVEINPNPFFTSVHIHAEGEDMEGIKITIRDLQGRIILSDSYAGMTSRFDTGFDLSNIRPGIYFLQFRANNSDRTFKLVKYE